MAEGVQFQLERQLEELEQMVHCGLFTKAETAAIVKKRKQFEYKVHRHSKSKEDYLKYIEYESAVLALLRKRRENEGYAFRKKEIDHAILNRIHSLFRAAIKRFQGDVSLWLTYIEFCKEKRNPAMVSRTFSDLLAIHNQDPSLWVYAAQWEMEANKDAETARSLLQRGLRFLGESTTLWKEYLRMELIHVETMRKRMLTLTSASSAEDTLAADSVNDPVLSGKIVAVVYRQALAALPDNVNLLFEFLEIAKSFADILSDLETWIYEDLKQNYSTEPRSWDALARRHIGMRTSRNTSAIPGGDEDVDIERRRVADVETGERSALIVFEEGLTQIEDAKLWKLAITFAVETLENGAATEPTLTKSRFDTAIDLLKRAETDDKITEELYLVWIRILRNFDHDDTDDDDDFPTVLSRALEKLPSSLDLWSVKLQKTINDSAFGGPSAVEQTLKAAVATVNEKEAWKLWETYLDWMTKTCGDQDKIDSAFKRASTTTGREESKLAKEAYVKYVAENGKDEAKIMCVYDWLRTHRPHSGTYYRFVIGHLEDDKEKKRVFLDAIDELGKVDVDLWLEYEAFESKRGSADVGLVYKRALRELEQSLIPKYEVQHTLTATGHLGPR